MNRESLRALPLLFGRPVLTDLARTGRSAVFSRVARGAGLGGAVRQVYETAYMHLLHAHRCEYVFKNTIARRLLIDRHPWGEARLMSEFRVGPCKADLVILNGTSTVYEIKTGLDNLGRLHAQLEAYRLVFDRIYVVCERSQAERIADSVGPGVGIVTIGDDAAVTEARTAASNAANTRPPAMLAALRKPEYLSIIAAETGDVPQVPNGRLWGECVRIAGTLDPERVHARMVQLLRARPVATALRETVMRAPAALTHGILALQAGPRDLAGLDHALESALEA